MRIDLNADLGESFGAWTMGDDDAMLSVVTSANVACGFHAGDPRTMRRTVARAVERGVRIGAHVSYRDLAGFGRRFLDVDPEDLTADVLYQIGALEAVCRAAGGRVAYVKPHGALYNRIVHDERQASAVVRAMVELDPTLVLLGPPGAVVLDLAEEAGLTTATEAFADRAYTPDGRLVSRREPGAVLHDPTLIADRMLTLVQTGRLTAVDGTELQLSPDSICVHGDTDGAVAVARAVREKLETAGVAVKPFATR